MKSCKWLTAETNELTFTRNSSMNCANDNCLL